MGPNCEVLIEHDDPVSLDMIDALLANKADQIERTRKGRGWDVWINSRLIHMTVDGSRHSVMLSAGCNGAEDFELLRALSQELACTLGGVASEPVK